MRPLFDEIKSYIGFGRDDESALRRFLPAARPHFDAIVAEFYAIARLYAGAANVLHDEAQVFRLERSLVVWLEELLSGPWDDAYLERRARIGQVHVKVGLAQHYMVTAMSRMRARLQSLAAESFRDDPEADRAVQLAIARICDVDLAIMLESYRDDVIARLHRMEQIEKDALLTRMAGLERLYRQATEAAELLMITLDASFKVLVFNPTASKVTGYASDEMRERDPFPILFGEEAEAARKKFVEAPEATPIEHALLTRAGHRRLVRWRIAHQEQHDVEGPAYLLTGLDITEEQRLEKRARIHERLAVAGTLAAGLAHEIRNPLNGASLHVAVLERSLSRLPDLPETATESAEVLKREIKRLSALVTDFLDVARPRPIKQSACDLNEVLDRLVTLVRPEADGRGVEVTLDRFPFPVTASIDPERIQQAVLNLLQNAIDAAGQGGHVTLRVRQKVHDAYIEVEDDGPGLPDASAPIFDAFFTTKERGTGLGLSIVHRIAADHGGDVAFQSRPGQTIFTLRFPLDFH